MSSMIVGDDIFRYRLICLAKALQIHVNTGGKLRLTRVNYIKVARSLGYRGRTAKALLQDILSKHPELNRG